MKILLLTPDNLVESYNTIDTYNFVGKNLPMLIDYDFVVVDLSSGEVLSSID